MAKGETGGDHNQAALKEPERSDDPGNPASGGTTMPGPAGRPGGNPPNVSLKEAARVWARIGVLSFGGPAGQIALMHRMLVEERGWISERRFLHALNFCMLLPGPEAQQLATYVGWLLHRIRGGLVAGSLFILPGFLVILGLSTLYVAAGDLPLVQGIFTGLKPAVIVIVLQALIRIAGRSLRSALLGALAVAAFVAMFVFQVPFPYVIAGAALVGLIGSRGRVPVTAGDPGDGGAHAASADTSIGYMARCLGAFGLLWLAPPAVLLAALGPDDVFANIGIFFSKMAVLTFGGAYAVLAYVSQEAVAAYGWLAPGEMIDGLAMAETTPGPLIMVVQFVGFLAAFRESGPGGSWLAGLWGSLLTIWVTFVPCFLWIFLGAPHIERLRRNPLLSGALSAVTAAVVGVVANLAVWFSIHALFAQVRTAGVLGVALDLPEWRSLHVPSLLITGIAAVLVFRGRASVPVTLLVTSLLGMGTTLLPP